MPSTKTTGSRRRAQSQPPSPPVAQAADGEGAALFDQAPPVETAITSDNAVVETPEPSSDGSGDEQGAPPPADHVDAEPAEPPVVDPEPAPLSDEQPQADAGSSVAAIPVRIGHVEGVLHRVPVVVVQDLLADSVERIATLRASRSILDLQERMRASEGRCAPVFFTVAEGDDRPRLFSGIESVAAAMNLGLECVFVVTLASGDAVTAQAYLAAQANRPAPPKDDPGFGWVTPASPA